MLEEEAPITSANDLIPLPGRCVRCRYDLIGLAEEQACPECGLPVAASKRSEQLINVPALKTLGARIGLWMIVVTSAYIAIYLVIAMVSMILFTMNPNADLIEALLGVLGLFWEVEAWLTVVVVTAAWWMACSFRHTRTMRRLSTIVRALFLVNAGALLALSLGVLGFSDAGSEFWWLDDAVGSLIGSASLAAGMVYLMQIDRLLANSKRRWLAFTILSLLIYELFMVVAVMLGFGVDLLFHSPLFFYLDSTLNALLYTALAIFALRLPGTLRAVQREQRSALERTDLTMAIKA